MNLRSLPSAVLFVGLAVSAAMPGESPGEKPGENPAAGTPQRPETLGVDATLVFLYYRDTARAQRFYEDILGLELVVEQAFTNIYRISPTSFVGLVDEARGMHRASENKAVTLSFITDEVDAWYDYLVSRGVEMRGPLRDSSNHPTRGFVAFDPEGYFLEFETFLDHPENTRLRAALGKTPR